MIFNTIGSPFMPFFPIKERLFIVFLNELSIMLSELSTELYFKASNADLIVTSVAVVTFVDPNNS